VLGGRRVIVVAVLAAIPLIAAVVFAAAGELDPRVFWARLLQRLVIPTVTAFVAVVIGTSALAEEREDGTILYLASTPLSRLSIVLTKTLAAWTACLLVLIPSVLVAGLVALRGQADAASIGWPLFGIATSALCYCAVSTWLAMAVRRPMVIGVLYILAWEGSIATFAASADRLSIAAYARAISVEGVIDVSAPETAAATAVIVLLVVSALAVWRAGRRLARTELP
jgi:ABC-2 type transport system permease protein